MGTLSMIWVLANAQIDIARGILAFPKKPLDVHNCAYNFTEVLTSSTMPSSDTDGYIANVLVLYCPVQCPA